MIWAAIAAAVVTAVLASQAGGRDVVRGLLDTLQKLVKKRVKDETRRTRAQAILLEGEADLLEAYDATVAGLQAFGVKNQDYAATFDELAATIDIAVDASVKGIEALIAAGDGVGEVLTDEELTAIAAPFLKKAAKDEAKLEKEIQKRLKKAAKREDILD